MVISEYKRNMRGQKRITENLVTNDKNNARIKISTSFQRGKRKISLHNFSLKFPLQKTCKIPFSNKMRKTSLNNNSIYMLDTSQAHIRQTTRNLIIYPLCEELAAIPGNSQELKAKMRAKAQAIAKALQSQYIGLRIFRAIPEPTTQEYAVKDSFAEQLDFVFKNELGKFDKSTRVNRDGHKTTGGEIEYFTPEHADDYLRMPLVFMKAMSMFEANMASHVAAIRLIGMAADQQVKATESLNKAVKKLSGPARSKMPTSYKRSATIRGVN